MKETVRKLIMPRIKCSKLQKKVSLKRDLTETDKFLLLDTLGVNDVLRSKSYEVEEYYQELCYHIEGVK